MTAQQIIQTSIVNVISPLEQNITIVDFQYIPANITISIGTKVIWTNNGPSPHTVTSDTNIFNSGNMGVGAKWNYTFNQSGSFPYHCAIHPSMLGIVIVTGGENFPPNKPTLDGPSSVKTGIAISYTAVTIDPEGDNIQYYFDWGDGTNTGWLPEVTSGTISHQSHTWNTKGTYIISVKARDTSFAESPIATLSVIVPADISHSLYPHYITFQWFFTKFVQMFLRYGYFIHI